MNDLTSRYVVKTDEHVTHFFFELNPLWWSRFYEYPWAAQFMRADDVVLDAACGISHPFKFYALDKAREVVALDNDPRILRKEAIQADVVNDFGQAQVGLVTDRYFTDIQYVLAPLEKMSLPDKKFDRVFCISVLEHVQDWCNQYRFLNRFHFLRSVVPHGIPIILGEFKRVLKDDGLIVLTFDYPTINIDYFLSVLPSVGLEFAGPVDTTLPTDALYSVDKELYCFRVVLKKSATK